MIGIVAPNVTVAGFTLRDSPTGIAVHNYNYNVNPLPCTIIGNIITNCSEGIRTKKNNLLVIDNNITRNSAGITGYNTENVVIAKNNMIGNKYVAINIGICRNITIIQNNIRDSEHWAINLRWYGPYTIQANQIMNNTVGIHFGEGAANATVVNNRLEKNSVGVKLMNFPNGEPDAVSGTGNTVCGNDFVNNTQQVLAQTALEVPNIKTSNNGTDFVQWDNGTVGNFWSDYNGVDANGDGKGDTSYVIGVW